MIIVTLNSDFVYLARRFFRRSIEYHFRSTSVTQQSYAVLNIKRVASNQILRGPDLPAGQINGPTSGKYYSPLFLQATPLSPFWILEGLFKLTWRLSRALDSPRALLPELQRYKDTIKCAALGAEVPVHRHEQLTQTLMMHL